LVPPVLVPATPVAAASLTTAVGEDALRPQREYDYFEDLDSRLAQLRRDQDPDTV